MAKANKDILNKCGHRNSERVAALKEFPSAVCPACLVEQIEELEQLLIEYGRHQAGCPAQFNTSSNKHRCRCGWNREKENLKGK